MRTAGENCCGRMPCCIVGPVAASHSATSLCATLLSSVLSMTCRYEVVSDAVYDTRDPAIQKLLFTGKWDVCARILPLEAVSFGGETMFELLTT